jgi:hypothetical protein
METIVLDDHGRGWDARSPTLRRFLHCPFPDFDFLTYIIDNLGFVTVTKTSPHAVRIRMRPELASPTSLGAALYCIADMELERIIISHSGETNIDRLFPSVAQAVAYIAEQIAGGRQRGPLTPLSREQPIDLLVNAEGPLSSLLAHWTNLGHIYDAAALADTLTGALRQRFMVVESTDDRLTIVEVGAGFESFGSAWRENALGLPIEEQPDYDYGRWVQGMFRRVCDTEMPRLDDVDALIRRPDKDDRVHVRYRRLILPFKSDRCRTTRLLGASVVDQTLDLGIDAG